MAVMKNKDCTELMVDCHCGCDEGIRIRIDHDYPDDYCFVSYTNGRFYAEQGETIWGILTKKFEKIWAIIRNKDYYYSEITMTKDEFETFREYINSVGECS
jgi:hypothetical protein